jgi:ABC-2 type transport system permease protein
MSWVLVRKLLRDVRWNLLVVALLLAAFEFLYAKVTEQTLEVNQKMEKQLGQLLPIARDLVLKKTEGGQILQKVIGGDEVDVTHPMHVLSISYVHPLVQTILCIWGIGRAASAVAGEIDRGTLELLLAQPIPRYQVIGSHFMVDVLTIPVLCLSMWAGTAVGAWYFDLLDPKGLGGGRIDPWRIWPGLFNVAALVFAVSGYTLLMSACGRFRARVLGVAVVVTLLQFMINLIGQIWDVLGPLRPFTVFYYYQPQPLILGQAGAAARSGVNLGVLCAVGVVGYLLALVVFCRRDLPAPL